jgi:predicted metal-binding membrane protein
MTTLSFAPTRVMIRWAVAAGVLGALAVGAWFASIDRMQGMDMGSRFTVGSFGFFVVLWVLMMAAMMFPSVWPAVTMHTLALRKRGADGAAFLQSGLFVAGYLASWTLFGFAAFGLLALARASGLDTLSTDDVARYGVAPTAFVAAAYQFLPFKRTCLKHCRGPLSFFMQHWRDGRRGALTMGTRHGAFCVGCCWVLMLVLLALGVMSITWMVVVSVAIAVEKLAPARLSLVASGLLKAGLVTLGVVALARPSWLPGMDAGMGMGGDDMGNDMDKNMGNDMGGDMNGSMTP